MRRIILTLAAASAVLLASGHALAQEELTEESVQAAFETQNFQHAFGTCFIDMDKPEEVTLVVIIDGSGNATLSSVQPLMLAQTKTCIGNAVVGFLKFPATGGDYEITYPLAVPEVSADAAHPTTTAQPTTTTQPVVVGTAPVMATTAVPESSWRPLYNTGRRKIISGAITLGVGGVVLVMPGLLLMLYGTLWADVNDDMQKVFTSAGVVMVGLGLIPVIIGAILIGKGKRQKAHALKIRDGLARNDIPLVGFGPTPDGRGGQLSLSWMF